MKNFVPPETRYELKLFKKLQSLGYNVVHNQKLHGFYPDLLLVDFHLIIEVDGGIHRLKSKRRSDQKRTEILENYGFKVIRFENCEIVRELPKCIKTIELAIKPNEAHQSIDIDKAFVSVLKRRRKACEGRNKKTAKASSKRQSQYLVNDPAWQDAVCKKLGISQTKPDRVVLNLPPIKD